MMTMSNYLIIISYFQNSIFKDIQNNKSINSTPSVNKVDKNNTYEYEKLS